MRNGCRLLVVEDDAGLCESIAEVLRFTGYEVDTACDGEAALRVLQECPRPDAIVLDVVLPRMGAEELLQVLDASPWPRPPVVLMTGMIGAQRPSPRDVLLKPFELDELLSRVAAACSTGAAGARGDAAP